MKLKWFKAYLFFWILLGIYSFTRLDLNLTLYNLSQLNPSITWLQNLGHYQRPLASAIFVFLSLGLYCAYLKINQLKKINLKSIKLKKTKLIIIFLSIIVVGLLAYPMFSHDIFNYLFNAKMVLVYKQNPHLVTALSFPNDTWTRFMHNIHTPAPYAYGWTGISLIPVFLGLPNFTLSLWLTKLLIFSFFALEVYLFYLLAKKINQETALSKTFLLALNPLILVETFINGHNDSLMISLAFLAFIFLYKKSNFKNYLLSGLTLLVSISIKFATVVLAPLIPFHKKLKHKVFDYAGIFLLLTLLSRPGQLNSWYLHWGISFLLLSNNKKLVNLAILLSFGGLLRYTPFIYYGHWDNPVTLLRWLILLLPLTLLIFKKTRYALFSKN